MNGEGSMRSVPFFALMVAAGLLPAGLPFDMSKCVAGSYLERARASVTFD
jgi:hypothetical protein